MEWMTESNVDKLGHQHACAPASVPNNETTVRKRFDEPSRSVVERIKPLVTFDMRVEEFKQVQRLKSPGLIAPPAYRGPKDQQSSTETGTRATGHKSRKILLYFWVH